MKKLLLGIAIAAVASAPVAASASDQPGVTVGGRYGHPLCYVELDYWRIGVDWGLGPIIATEGNLGGEPHCPIV